MSLEEKLREKREASSKIFPEETREKIRRATQELRASGIVERALSVGKIMPEFSLVNTKGEIINSNDLLKQGNLVVTFYRGVW